jgi:TBC1 domain family member 6
MHALQTVARIFDALLLEGSKMLHRIGLAVFKLAAPQLMKVDDTVAAAEVLQRTTRHLVDHDELMLLATKRIGRLRRKYLEQLRAVARAELGLPRPKPAASATPRSAVRSRDVWQ